MLTLLEHGTRRTDHIPGIDFLDPKNLPLRDTAVQNLCTKQWHGYNPRSMCRLYGSHGATCATDHTGEESAVSALKGLDHQVGIDYLSDSRIIGSGNTISTLVASVRWVHISRFPWQLLWCISLSVLVM